MRAADTTTSTHPCVRPNDTKFDIRLDNNFSNADSAFGRFSYEQAFSYVPGGSPGFAAQNAFGTNQHIINHARNLAIGETHVFSPTMVNQFNFGYNRIFNYISSFGTGTCASANIVPGGIPNANLGCSGAPAKCAAGAYSCGLVSTIVAGGYWAVGDRGYSPFQGGTNIFSYRDSLDLTRGRHNIHVGMDFRANQMNVGTEAFQDGFWIIGNGGNFTGLSTTGTNAVSIPGAAPADFLLGITGLATHDQTFNGPVTGRRWKIYRPFGEDDWRVTNSLTLNLGLAWAITTPISEAHARLANYVPATGDLLIANQNGVSSSAGVGMDWTALEPRVGGAWKVVPSGQHRHYRAGFAVYHDSAWSQEPRAFGEPAVPRRIRRIRLSRLRLQRPRIAPRCSVRHRPPSVSPTDFKPSHRRPPSETSAGSFYTQPLDFKLGRVRQYN